MTYRLYIAYNQCFIFTMPLPGVSLIPADKTQYGYCYRRRNHAYCYRSDSQWNK